MYKYCVFMLIGVIGMLLGPIGLVIAMTLMILLLCLGK